MPFVFLLLFALICLQTDWPAPRAGLTSEGCFILTGTLVLASWLVAGLISKALAWQLQTGADSRSGTLRRYTRWRRYHFIGLLAGYFALLYLCGWGNVLQGHWTEWTSMIFPVAPTDAVDPESGPNLPGFQVGLLIPFFVALLLSWERFHLVEKTAFELAHDGELYIGKIIYIVAQVRQQFFLVAPPVFLLLFQQVLFGFLPGLGDGTIWQAGIALGMIALAFVFMPVILRLFLGLKPLPPGVLRDRLEAAARRTGLGYSDILVWETRNSVANAMVTGLTPWFRYIILTDRLIDELTHEEIEAVFGHEVGHIKHYHLVFYLVFFLTSFIVLGLFWETIKEGISKPAWQQFVTSIPEYGTQIWQSWAEEAWDKAAELKSFGKLALLAGYTLLVFGYLSRRCERQADLYGAQTVSTNVFINALEKVAYINGIPRDRSGNWLVSWQHPTIAQRVEFLRAMDGKPAEVWRFHVSIVLIQLGCLAVLVALLVLFDPSRVWNLLAAGWV